MIVVGGVAFAAFVAGFGAYRMIHDAAGIVSINASELRELERRAAAGKQDLLREIDSLKEDVAGRDKQIVLLHEEIRKNQQPAKVKISNVVFDPPSPATLNIEDKIIVEFSYDIKDVKEIPLNIDFGNFISSRKILSGAGRTRLEMYVDRSSLLSSTNKSIDNKYYLLDVVSFVYYEPITPIIDRRTGRKISGSSLNFAITVPVQYKVRVNNITAQ